MLPDPLLDAPMPRGGRHRWLPLAAALLAGACGLPAGAAAQTAGTAGSAVPPKATKDSDTPGERQQAANRRVDDAAGVVHTMAAAPGMIDLLGRARGVYIVPTYARAALGVGGVGGSGVLVLRHRDGSWGNPAFFNIGGFSIGLQAGAESGALVLVLLNQKAVDSFRSKNNFSLSADAGFTVVNVARMAQGSTSGDVVAWSGGKGLLGNAATIGVNDIRYNERLTEACYGKPLTALQAVDSTPAHPKAEPLRKMLASVPPAGAGASR